MKLRQYQKELIDDIRENLKNGVKSLVAVLGCGGGKSVIQAELTKRFTDKSKFVIYLVHRKELCEQIQNTFTSYGVDMDYCLITSIQTFRKQKNFYFQPSLILVDEAHTNLHAYKKVFDIFSCFKIGFTATPTRMKEKGLGLLFEKMVTSVSTNWLIENKFLSPFKYFSVPLVDLAGVKSSASDFNLVELQDVMENKILYTGAVEQWLKLAENKKTMIYCTSVESSKQTIEEFKRNNISAVHVDGTMGKDERERIIKDFRNGKIKILSNVMLFSEGYDDKDIECVLLLRPTKSVALHTQQAMRGMRYKEGKTSIIIDCVGNVYRFGLPTEEQDWTLDVKKKNKQNEIKIKECKNCFVTVEIFHKTCPYCNHLFKENKIKNEDVKQEIKSDLIELDKNFKLSKIKLKEFEGKTWEEVEEFRKAKKYKPFWSLYYCIDHKIKTPIKYNKIKEKLQNDRT